MTHSDRDIIERTMEQQLADYLKPRWALEPGSEFVCTGIIGGCRCKFCRLRIEHEPQSQRNHPMTTKKPRKRKKLTYKYLNGLPLWKLLTIAMRDLRKQERAPHSVVDMTDWLVRNGTCKACMAGSVMRFSCGLRGSRTIREIHWDEPAWALAINALRMGFVGSAIEHLKRGAYVRHSQDRRMCGYASNREGFWRDITQLRDDLKKAGL